MIAITSPDSGSTHPTGNIEVTGVKGPPTKYFLFRGTDLVTQEEITGDEEFSFTVDASVAGNYSVLVMGTGGVRSSSVFFTVTSNSN